MKTNKKGQLGGPLQGIMGIIFALFFIGVLIFAFALAGGQMLSIEKANAVAAGDENSTSIAVGVINSTLLGAEAFADFSPTLWIMAAVAALLTILIGAVGVFFITRRE